MRAFRLVGTLAILLSVVANPGLAEKPSATKKPASGGKSASPGQPGITQRIFQDGDAIINSIRQESNNPHQTDAQLGLKGGSIKIQGVDRNYFVHLPPDYDSKKPMPLVLAFHGMTMKARQMAHLTGLSKYADKHSFIVVYPEGLNAQWMFGLGIGDAADVEFATVLLEKLCKDYAVDKKRVYATGISNGGFFSQYLAMTHSNLVAAVASVSATIEDTTYRKIKPTRPVSVMFMHGDDDSIIPYEGGSMGVSSALDDKGLHRCVSVHDAVKFWVNADGCNPTPTVTKIPDAKPADDTHVTREAWTGGKDGSEVILYTIKNGGHTWPSGWQYMPISIVGATTRAIDADDELWKFFQRHHL